MTTHREATIWDGVIYAAECMAIGLAGESQAIASLDKHLAMEHFIGPTHKDHDRHFRAHFAAYSRGELKLGQLLQPKEVVV